MKPSPQRLWRHYSNGVLACLLLHVSSSNAFLTVRPSVKSSCATKSRHPSQDALSRLIATNKPAPTVTPSVTARYGKLWQRLEIEEDIEPMWYLLNCIVTQELDLLRQCRARCGHMDDVVKFVVPIERSTRSHGPNRIVTDTKVGYPGYVFAKLRLCEEVYEAIQDLDLCRSWMGTVHKKGFRKLPPSPLALNEMEVEKFGLEELGEDVDFCDDPAAEFLNDEGIIVDTAENEEKAKAKGAKIDVGQLQAYLDLRPDDMVKVIENGKFKGEDGIVKRLKNGKIMVRFFTYGSTYEEWLEPKDVRKLSDEEVLRGLTGPSAPVTQFDLEGSGDDDVRNQRFDRNGQGGLRNALMSSVQGNRGPRNTRFERTQRGDQYKRDVFGRSDDERKNEERGWSRDQDRQGTRNRPVAVSDSNRRDARDNKDNPMVDMDSQWGRSSQLRDRRDRHPSGDSRTGQGDERKKKNADQSRNPRNDREIQQVQRALDGGDWSAFVGPSTASGSANVASNQADDAFFSSLMSELNGEQASTAVSVRNDDDFFSSLMSELEDGEEKSRMGQNKRQEENPGSNEDSNDFFAALEAELRDSSSTKTQDNNFMSEPVFPTTNVKQQSINENSSGSDDFFANLEKELAGNGFDSKSVGESKVPDDYFVSKLEADLAPPISSANSDGNRQQTTSKESLAKTTVPVLKQMLKERGLKVSGSKSELIDRLLK